MGKWSKTVKGSVIGAFIVAILGGIITGGFGLCKPSSTSPTVKTGDQHDGSVSFAADANSVKVTTVKTGDQHGISYIFTGDANDITIHQIIPPNDARNDIKALEDRVEDVNADVALTRNDLKMLTRALKDLEQRTSGIEKLPDGRTSIGTSVVTGHPFIVLDEHNAAAALYKEGDFARALEHSKRAIQAYEESQRKVTEIKPMIKVGNLNQSALATMYYVGALSAHKLNKNDQAYQWAEEANNLESSWQRIGLLATTLFNMNRQTDALQIIDKGLVRYPNNPSLVNLRNEISKRVGSQRI